MIEMKTCPHCGGAGILRSVFSQQHNNYSVFVKCSVCGAMGRKYFSGERPGSDYENDPACNKAVAAWNLRTVQDDQTGNPGADRGQGK